MKVTFINEIADLCERVGADVHDVARGIGLDGRIGRKFLHPGPGFGGSCFPKDTRALLRISEEAGVPLRLIEATIAVNEARKTAMASRIVAANGGSVQDKKIAVWGLTFKPETDDMRDAPSIPIVKELVEQGAIIHAFDPVGMNQAKQVLPTQVLYCSNALAAASEADILVVITEWNEFRAISPTQLKQAMRGRVILDFRNVFDASAMRQAGFQYSGVGR